MTKSTKLFSQRALNTALEISLEKKYSQSIEKHYKNQTFNWYLYARSFIDGTRELLNSPKFNGQETHYLNIAVLFNFRHSLELAIKFILMVINKKSQQISSEKSLKGHDLLKLIIEIQTKDRFKKFLQSERIITKIKKSFKVTAKKNVIQITNFIITNYDKFVQIVQKHHFNLPIMHKIDNNSIFIEDTSNQFFRYPSAKNVKIEIPANEINKIKLEQSYKSDLNKIKSITNTVFLLSL